MDQDTQVIGLLEQGLHAMEAISSAGFEEVDIYPPRQPQPSP